MKSTKRRKAIHATTAQLHILRQMFSRTDTPSNADRTRLSDETGLDFQWITDWFRRQKSLAKRGGSGRPTAKPTPREDAARFTDDGSQEHPFVSTSEYDISSNIDISRPGLLSAISYSHFHPYDSSILRLPRNIDDVGLLKVKTTSQQPGSEGDLDSYSLSAGKPENSNDTGVHPLGTILRPPTNMRSLTRSPSLGYIPSAFPTLTSAGLSSIEAKSQTEVIQSDEITEYSSLSKTPGLVALCTISPEFLADTVSQSFRTSEIYSELVNADVQSAADVSQRLHPMVSTTSESFLGHARSAGLQSNLSHRTRPIATLQGNQTPSSQFIPSPIAFKLRLSDLRDYHRRLQPLAPTGNAQSQPVAGCGSRAPGEDQLYRLSVSEAGRMSMAESSDPANNFFVEQRPPPSASPSGGQSHLPFCYDSTPPQHARPLSRLDALDFDYSNKENKDPNDSPARNYSF